MKIKKRTAVAAVVALLVCIAVYLNWSYQKGLSEDVSDGTDTNDIVSDEQRLLGQIDLVNGSDYSETDEAAKKITAYFAELRLTRQQARDEAISTLKTTTEDDSLSLEAKEAAVASITALTNNSVTEARIESLIMSKGYKDCAVFLKEDSLSVVVAPPKTACRALTPCA